MRLLAGVLGMALLGLSACAELGDRFAELRGTPREAAIPVPAEQALSNAGRFPEDVKSDVEKPPPPLPLRKPEVPIAAVEAAQVRQADPESLVGLDFERTAAMLGDPTLLIEQPPAKIWAYSSGSCALHIFFYPKVGGSDFRVLTYEFRDGAESEAGRSAEPETAESKDFARLCLGELLAQAEANRASDHALPGQSMNGSGGGS